MLEARPSGIIKTSTTATEREIVATALSLHVPGAGRYQFEVSLDDRYRLHSGDMLPSITRNGKAFWHWHGVEVPQHVVCNPGRITVKEIDDETNAEVRRVMIERYGQTKYLMDCGAKWVNTDECGELYRKEFKTPNGWRWGDEPVQFVKVKNSTPEPDGTFKDYFLRVPPNVRTAKEGIAWTFTLEEKQYKPEVQT